MSAPRVLRHTIQEVGAQVIDRVAHGIRGVKSVLCCVAPPTPITGIPASLAPRTSQIESPTMTGWEISAPRASRRVKAS
jgi:hypothetical protein